MAIINKRCEIIEKIGAGATGNVFLVKDTFYENVSVALKTIQADYITEESLKSLKDEFLTLKQFDHPNLVKVFHFDKIVTSDIPEYLNDYFFTLSYIKGQDLFQATENASIEFLYEITYQICEALHYIHRHDLIHFDIKPENILITEEMINDERVPVAKIIDFGFAATNVGDDRPPIRGTLEYIAPELLRGETYDHRVDLYSLGMTLYHLITRTLPFAADSSIDIIKKQIGEVPPPISQYRNDIPENLNNIVTKLLEKDPAKRFPDAGNVIEHLHDTFPRYHILKNHIADIPPVKIIGRDEELETLLQKIKNRITGTPNGHSHFINVEGDTGIGKTALLTELARRIESDEETLLNARCYGESSAPYEPFRMVCKELLFILKKMDTTGEKLISQYNSVFETLTSDSFPGDKSNQKQLFEGVDSKLRFHDMVASFFVEFSKLKPFVMLVDDIHLADESSAELFQYIERSLADSPAIIIATSHPGKHDQRVPTRKNGNGVVSLEEFNEMEIQEFTATYLNTRHIDEDIVKTLHQEVGGLPYLLREFLMQFSSLASDEALRALNHALKDPEGKKRFPRTITQLYQNKLDQGLPEENNLLAILSCFPTPCDTKLCKEISPYSPERTIQFVNKLTRKGYLSVTGEDSLYHFAQRRFQQFIYDSIGEEKQGLHHLIAESLEKLYAGKTSEQSKHIAYHYRKAGDIQKAVHHYLDAAEYAISIFALNEYNQLLETCLDLHIEDESLIRTIMEKLGDGYILVADYGNAEKIYTQLLQHKNVPESKKILYLKSLGIAQIRLGQLDEATESLSEASALASSPSDQIEIESELVSIEIMRGNYSEAHRQCTKLLNEFSDKKSSPELSTLYNKMGIINFYQTNYEDALQHFSNSLGLLKQSGMKDKLIVPYLNLGNVNSSRENYEEAEYYWNEALKLCKEIGNVQQEAQIYNNLGIAAFQQEKYNESLNYYNKALNIFIRIGNTPGEALCLTNLGEVYLALSEFQNALSNLQQCLDINDYLQDNQGLAETHLHLADIFLQIGDSDRVCSHLEKAEHIIEEAGIDSQRGIFLLLSGKFEVYRNNYEAAKEFLTKACTFFETTNDSKQYYAALLEIARIERSLNNYTEAVELLNDVIAFYEKENLTRMRAEAFYESGLLFQQHKTDENINPLNQFNNAFKIIKDHHVSDLTWKVCYQIGKAYLKRGLNSKAKEFLIPTKKILNHFAASFTDESIRNHFLNNYDRKITIEEVTAILNRIG